MFSTIQLARAIACIMVLISHAAATISLPKYFGGSVFWGTLSSGDTGVDLFFVISGFLMFFIHNKDIGVPHRTKNFILKRFFRIYPVYWVYLVFLLIILGTGFFSEIKKYSVIELFDFFTLLDVSPTANPLPVAWTLYYEIFFYFMFASLIFSIRVGVSLGLFLYFTIFCQILNYTILKSFQTPLNDVTFSFYLMFEFLFGYLVFVFAPRLTRGQAIFSLLSGLLALVFCYVFVDHWMTRDVWPPIRLVYGACFALLLAGGLAFENHRGFRLSTPLKLVGDASYTIYLAHFPLVSLMCKILVFLKLPKYVNIYFGFSLVAIGSLLVCLALYYIVEKPLIAFFAQRLRSIKA